METFPEQWLVFLNSSTSQIGLVVESLFLILISAGMISLLRSSQVQIHQKDLKRSTDSFIIVIFLNLIAIALWISQLTETFLFQEYFYQAYYQLKWSISLISIGWLWIKPSQQSRFSIFKRIFITTSFIFFLLQAGQLIELFFHSSGLIVPYSIIWRVFQNIVGIFLFFVFLENRGNLLWSGLVFTGLQIIGLGLSSITNLPHMFFQSAAQMIAFLFSTHTLLAVSIDQAALKQISEAKPVLLSENVAAIPNTEMIRAWMQVDHKDEEKVLPFALCKALAATVFADACLFIHADESDQIKIKCGYSIAPNRQILPIQIISPEKVVLQQRSVIFHEMESFPVWVKAIIKKSGLSKIRSVWYVPIRIVPLKYYLVFMSRNVFWTEQHVAYMKQIQPYIDQVIWKYVDASRSTPQPVYQENQNSTNPYINLMRMETGSDKEIEVLEEELKLALEEYNRIRNILEERGIGQEK